MRSAPSPWAIVPALAVLWFAPAINRWFQRQADRQTARPDPWRSMHKTPTQVTIIRRGTGSELERRND